MVDLIEEIAKTDGAGLFPNVCYNLGDFFEKGSALWERCFLTPSLRC